MLLPQFTEITYFGLYHQNKSSESNLNFRQASNHWKRALEAGNLACPSLPKNLALGTFGKLLMFSTKVDLQYLLYSTALFSLLELI